MLDSKDLNDQKRSLLEESGTKDWSPGIDDREYIADLRKLKELRSFLIETGGTITGEGGIGHAFLWEA